MGYAQPGDRRRGDGEAVASGSRAAGAAGLIVADLTPGRRAPFEAVARAARAGGRLPRRTTTTPKARRAAIARDGAGGFLYYYLQLRVARWR
jgi:tryptophan synthase alpha subunit